MKKMVLILFVALAVFVSGCTDSRQNNITTNQNNYNIITDQPQEIYCEIQQDSTDPCPPGYMCYWSCPGANCTEPEGDLSCHLLCNDDSDCLGTSTPYCRPFYISRGDAVQSFSFCVR